jgi:hypothetical protein
MTPTFVAWVAATFGLACSMAFVSGWMVARHIWYRRGFYAGTARSSRLAARYYEPVEPTEVVRSSQR